MPVGLIASGLCACPWPYTRSSRNGDDTEARSQVARRSIRSGVPLREFFDAEEKARAGDVSRVDEVLLEGEVVVVGWRIGRGIFGEDAVPAATLQVPT